MIADEIISTCYAIGVVTFTTEEAVSASPTFEDIISSVAAEGVVAMTTDEVLTLLTALNVVITTAEVDHLIAVSEGDVTEIDVVVLVISGDRVSISVDHLYAALGREPSDTEFIGPYIFNLIQISRGVRDVITGEIIASGDAIRIVAFSAEEAISAGPTLEDIVTTVTAEGILAVPPDEYLITSATLNMIVTAAEVDDLLIISEGHAAEVEMIIGSIGCDRASVGINNFNAVIRVEAREAQLILTCVLDLVLIT